jgi:hypothetical protein
MRRLWGQITEGAEREMSVVRAQADVWKEKSKTTTTTMTPPHYAIGCTPIFDPLDRSKILAVSLQMPSGFGRFFFADGTEKDWPLGKGIEENTPDELAEAQFAASMPMPGWRM